MPKISLNPFNSTNRKEDIEANQSSNDQSCNPIIDPILFRSMMKPIIDPLLFRISSLETQVSNLQGRLNYSPEITITAPIATDHGKITGSIAFENRNNSFENYQTDHTGIDQSTRKELKAKIESITKDFCLPNEKESKLILLSGKAGIGKTHLANAIALFCANKGKNVLYCNMSNVLKLFDQASNDRMYTANGVKKLLQQHPIIIIDDYNATYLGISQQINKVLIAMKTEGNGLLVLTSNLPSNQVFQGLSSQSSLTPKQVQNNMDNGIEVNGDLQRFTRRYNEMIQSGACFDFTS